MAKPDAVIEDWKALPPAHLDRAADYIQRLKRITDQERNAIIDRTAGSLTREEADEWERIIAEGCEQLDEHGRKRPQKGSRGACELSVLHEEPSQERVAISDTASRTLRCCDHRPGRKGSFRHSLGNRGAAASITAGRVEAKGPEATRENREVTPCWSSIPDDGDRPSERWKAPLHASASRPQVVPKLPDCKTLLSFGCVQVEGWPTIHSQSPSPKENLRLEIGGVCLGSRPPCHLSCAGKPGLGALRRPLLCSNGRSSSGCSRTYCKMN
jgi:hypothetical protein